MIFTALLKLLSLPKILKMKTLYTILAAFIFLSISCKDQPKKKLQKISPAVSNSYAQEKEKVIITPIQHASMILDFFAQTIYVDPVGAVSLYDEEQPADLILLTDIHADHLDTLTLAKLVNPDTKIIAPIAVKNKLSPRLQEKTIAMKNGETKRINSIEFKAIPMYNLREEAGKFHPKGRGNGYVLTGGETKIYLAGDTEDIPEMRNLKNIDIAFIPMNLPYTMPVGAAADAVLDFQPKKVYPYHYKGKNGFSDVAKFKNIIETNSSKIDVIQLDWYPKI